MADIIEVLTLDSYTPHPGPHGVFRESRQLSNHWSCTVTTSHPETRQPMRYISCDACLWLLAVPHPVAFSRVGHATLLSTDKPSTPHLCTVRHFQLLIVKMLQCPDIWPNIYAYNALWNRLAVALQAQLESRARSHFYRPYELSVCTNTKPPNTLVHDSTIFYCVTIHI